MRVVIQADKAVYQKKVYINYMGVGMRRWEGLSMYYVYMCMYNYIVCTCIVHAHVHLIIYTYIVSTCTCMYSWKKGITDSTYDMYTVLYILRLLYTTKYVIYSVHVHSIHQVFI